MIVDPSDRLSHCQGFFRWTEAKNLLQITEIHLCFGHLQTHFACRAPRISDTAVAGGLPWNNERVLEATLQTIVQSKETSAQTKGTAKFACFTVETI
jgi:hypothetical protein